MRDRLAKLFADWPKPDQSAQPLELPELLRLDRECFILHLYFVRFLKNTVEVRDLDADDPEAKFYEETGAKLVSGLLDGPMGLWRADALVQSMELGVTREALERAFKDGKVRIEARPSKLMVDEMMDFTLVFDDRGLADSPLLSSFGIQWDFGVSVLPSPVT